MQTAQGNKLCSHRFGYAKYVGVLIYYVSHSLPQQHHPPPPLWILCLTLSWLVVPSSPLEYAVCFEYNKAVGNQIPRSEVVV